MLSVARKFRALCSLLSVGLLSPPISGADQAYLTEVPDYSWFAGCFGTASGNLMGFWDRHGFPGFYTGPTAGGVAPLNDFGMNKGIRSMWASQAGIDGRPTDQPGHIDDYWLDYDSDVTHSYESTAPDPYLTAGRPEHEPDCIGDFIGLSQNRWEDMNGECDGNIDAYSFVYWDPTGERRVNFVPGLEAGRPALDTQSGLRAWTRFRGYDSTVFTQLTEFNPNVPSGGGFTFEDLKAEIDAGYPVLLFLQDFDKTSRALPGMPQANPPIHGMLAYGYFVAESGGRFVRYRTSWASGDVLKAWGPQDWEVNLPVRGVIGFRPLPKITSIGRSSDGLTIAWDGPSARLQTGNPAPEPVHRYLVEKTDDLGAGQFEAVSAVTTDRQVTIENCCDAEAFFRVRLIEGVNGAP